MGDRVDVREALEKWDREADRPFVEEAERQRLALVERFPLEDWPNMPLERYACGFPGNEDTFCRWVEFRTPNLGGIGGGSARKHMIFKRANQPGWWYYDPRFRDEREAWETIRAGFVRAFELAERNEFDAIGDIEPLTYGPSVATKAVHVYYPDKLLPVYGRLWQEHWHRLLGGDGQLSRGVPGARRLLELAREHRQFDGWSPREISRLLGFAAGTLGVGRVVKIAPGPDAEFWEECRAGGYICVGWDELGDLRDYASKDELRQRFAEFYPTTPGKTTEKVGEIWTLLELEPGDTIVANRGTKAVVGIGKVVEPGYIWRPDRRTYKHTVKVDWYDTRERKIHAIRKWAFKTVDDLSATDWLWIQIGQESPSGADSSVQSPVNVQQTVTPLPMDPILVEIESALRRKGQVIVYGPPRTGKTYTARRFSVWWLRRDQGAGDAELLLADGARFSAVERLLSTAQAERRVWWMVANPAQWQWDQLFKDGSVDYRYGRLQRNYALAQPGDLVVGYTANPDKRIMALARVRDGLHLTPEGQQISLEPVARVNYGMTYDELRADPVLANSEPIRFRNQGTLFALTPHEAQTLLSALAERDPSLPDVDASDAGGIGQLTRVTFHPSYSYEDFVEGYKPVSTSTGTLDLQLSDGVFKRVCRAAQADPDRPYLLLIDEINRGNIPKIFGELITLLERDKRGLTVVLPSSRETFSVPANVYVIGTMNTADRSIKLLDAALRRRFAFIELMPERKPLEGGRVNGLDVALFLEELNRRIVRREGREKQIGHSFLLDDGQPVASSTAFADRFRHEILPLLQEYSYEDYRELGEYLGSQLVDVDAQSLRREILDDADALVAALVDEYQREGPRGAGTELPA